ncbi:MAG: ABC transporter substrate-binding protein [Micromonosporaceae bacterium]
MTSPRRATRLIALFTIAATGFAAAACGNSTAPDQDSKAPLEIWIRKPPGSNSEKTTKELAAAFTKQTGVKTTVTAVFEDFETKLQQAAAGKKLPDIVINDTGQLGTLVKQGLVREVDRDTVKGQDALTDLSWEAAKGADGKYYGAPFSAQAFALFIRKDWREKVGAEPPASWADLDALASAFTRKDPDGNGKHDTYGYVIPGSTKRGYMAWYFSSFLWAGGGDFLTERDRKFSPAIASPSSVSAVSWLKAQFCDAKTVAPGAVTMETTQAHPLFETGKAGIYLTGPYNLARFDGSLGKDKYEIVPPPAGPGGSAASLAEGENVYLMAGSKNQAGQDKFAEYAISADGQTLGMAGDTDGNIVRLPVNTGVKLADVRTDERWKIFDDVYRDAGRYTPAVPDWTPFRQSAAEALNGIVADCGSNPKAELDKLAETFAAELDRQGVAA